MNMLKTLLCLCFAISASAWPAPAWLDKPRALVVTLELTDAQGEFLDVTLSVSSVVPVRELAWELALPPGARVLEGRRRSEPSSEDAPAKLIRVRERLRVQVPLDGRAAALQLSAHATLPKTAGERVGADTGLVLDPGPGPEVLSTLLTPALSDEVLAAVSTGAAVEVLSSGALALGQVIESRRLIPSVSERPRARLRAPSAGGEKIAEETSLVSVSGSLHYEDKEWDFFGWTGERPLLPIRRADLFVFDAQSLALLGVGSSDEQGQYALRVPLDQPTDLILRVDTDTSLRPDFQRIRVLSFDEGFEYSVLSATALAHDPGLDLDLGRLVVPIVKSGNADTNPFNVFDQGVNAFKFLLGPLIGAQAALRPVEIFTPTFFGGSSAPGTEIVLDNDDGLDDAVILHEIGHVVHDLYSDYDLPPGDGFHFFGQSDQDPRLSITEGFATFFAANVLQELGRDPVYVDAIGSASMLGVQVRFRLENGAPFLDALGGAADEAAVAASLYDLIDDRKTKDFSPRVDDDPFDLNVSFNGKTPQRAWFEAMVSPLVAEAAEMTFADVWDAFLVEHSADPQLAALVETTEAWKIRFVPDEQEPDNTPALAAPTPVFDDASWNGDRTLYFATTPEGAPGSGDVDWYEHELTAGSRVLFRTRYLESETDAETMADTMLEVFDAEGQLLASDTDSGFGRNAFIANFLVPATGTYRVRVSAQPNEVFGEIDFRRYGTYNYRAAFVAP